MDAIIEQRNIAHDMACRLLEFVVHETVGYEVVLTNTIFQLMQAAYDRAEADRYADEYRRTYAPK